MSGPTSSTGKAPAANATTRWLTAAGVVLALVWIGLATWLPFARLWYPFGLEWLEGLVDDHSARILAGEALYLAPSPDFVPLLYTPLYMYLGAGMSWVVGEGIPALRLVSIVAALAAQVMLFVFVRSATRSRTAGLLACGLSAGSYFVVDTWWDVARVDSTFVAFVLAGLVLLDRKGMVSALLAAAAMVLAYLTKQTALPIAGAFAVSALIRAPRRGLVFATTFAALWFAAVGVGDAMTDGWFSRYTWDLPNDHEYDLGRLRDLVALDLLPMLPVLALVAWHFARGLCGAGRRAALAQGAWWGGLFVAGILSRCHQGGAVNALMPAWLGCCAVAGMAWAAGIATAGRGRQRLTVQLLVLLQLVMFAADFGNAERRVAPGLRDLEVWLPTAADASYGRELVARLRDTEGDVLVPFHPYLARMAGKRGSANIMAVYDVRGENSRALMEPLRAAFLDSARQREATLVVLDGLEGVGDLWRLVLPGYARDGSLVAEGDDRTFVPRVGLPTRPHLLFRRLD